MVPSYAEKSRLVTGLIQFFTTIVKPVVNDIEIIIQTVSKSFYIGEHGLAFKHFLVRIVVSSLCVYFLLFFIEFFIVDELLCGKPKLICKFLYCILHNLPRGSCGWNCFI